MNPNNYPPNQYDLSGFDWEEQEALGEYYAIAADQPEQEIEEQLIQARAPPLLQQQDVEPLEQRPSAPQIPRPGKRPAEQAPRGEPEPIRPRLQDLPRGRDGKAIYPPAIIKRDVDTVILKIIPKAQPRFYIHLVKEYANGRVNFSKDSVGYDYYESYTTLFRAIDKLLSYVQTKGYSADLPPAKVASFYGIIQSVLPFIIQDILTSKAGWDHPTISDAVSQLSALFPVSLSKGKSPVQPAQRPPAQPAQRPPAQPAQRPPAQPAQRPPAQPAQFNPKEVPLVPSSRGYERTSDSVDPLENLDDPCFKILKNALYNGTFLFF